MATINFKKFLFLCFIDIALVAIINERHGNLGFYLLFPLTLISLKFSIENINEIEDHEYNDVINDSEELTIKKKSRRGKKKKVKIIETTSNNENEYNDYKYKFIDNNDDFEDNLADETENSTDDIFQSNENEFYYKKVNQMPNFPENDQLKVCDQYFINPIQKSRPIKLNLIRNRKGKNKSNQKNEIESVQKNEEEQTNKMESEYEILNFEKGSVPLNTEELQKKLRHLGGTRTVLQEAHDIKKFLYQSYPEYKKGLDFIAKFIITLLKSSKHERRSSFFALALSEIVHKNDPFRQFFESCFYKYCKQANPNDSRCDEVVFRNDDYFQVAHNESNPASIIFCYWIFIDDKEKLFVWANTHSQFDENISPNFSIGTAFFDLIHFGGKTMYDMDEDHHRVIELIDNALEFFTKCMNYFDNYKDLKVYGKFYKKIPDTFKEFRECVMNEDDAKMSPKFNAFIEFKYIDDQEKIHD